MKRHILLAFGFIFAALASMAAVGDRFQDDGIWYEVLDEEAKTCQTAAAMFTNIELKAETKMVWEEWNNWQGAEITVYDYVLTGDNDPAAPYGPKSCGPNLNNEKETYILPSDVLYGKEVYELVAIGDFSFALSSIKNIVLPETVKTIGRGAFFQSQLQSIDMKNVETLSEFCFAKSSIKDVKLSPYIKEVPKGAFYGGELQKIDLANVVTIGESSFSNTNLQPTVKIPPTTTHILDNAFKGSTNMNIEFSEGLEYIGKSAFEECKGITPTLTLPDSLIEIDEAGFKGCTNIHYISFGKNLKKVGKEGFYRVCFNKAGMYLPASLTDIGTNAFNFQTNGSNLTDIYYPNANPVPTEPDAFGYDDGKEYKNFSPDYWIYSTVCLHVPVGTAQTYRQLTDWKYFRCIIDDLIPEDAESTHKDPEDPLSYIIDYIYLIPGETKNLNELIGETEDSMKWDPIDSEILSLDSNGDLVARSYGNDIALGYRKGNTKDTQWNGSQEINPTLAGAVIIFVCPTITVVYDKENLTENDGTSFRMNKAPRRVEEISENTTEAQDLKTHNTTYTHYVVSGSFPKVQVTPAPYMEIVKIERASLDDEENYIKGEGYEAGLKEVRGELYEPAEEAAYTGAVLPKDPITENRMLVVTMDIGDGVMTGNQEIEIDDKISVAVSGRTLSIIGADEDAEVLVSDIKGHIVYSGTGKVISLEPGIYIVKVEDAAFKAIVR